MNVVWGSNHLSNCVSLLSWADKIVLSVSTAPLRIDLEIPAAAQTGFTLQIRGNQVMSPTVETKVIETDRSVAILSRGAIILMAQAMDDDQVLLHLDLRAVGLPIYDDAAGLHIGGSTLANNSFSGCSTAIALG